MLLFLAISCCGLQNYNEIIAPWCSALDVYEYYMNTIKPQYQYKSYMLMHYDVSESFCAYAILKNMTNEFNNAEANLFAIETFGTESNSENNDYFVSVFDYIYELQSAPDFLHNERKWVKSLIKYIPFKELNEYIYFEAYFEERNCLIFDNCTRSELDVMKICKMLQQLHAPDGSMFRMNRRYILINLDFATEGKMINFKNLLKNQFNENTKDGSTLQLSILFPNEKKLIFSVDDKVFWCVSKCYMKNTYGFKNFQWSFDHFDLGYEHKDILFRKIMRNESYVIVNKWESQMTDLNVIKIEMLFSATSSFQICLYYFIDQLVLRIFILDEPKSTTSKDNHVYVLIEKRIGKQDADYIFYIVRREHAYDEKFLKTHMRLACCYSENTIFQEYLVKNIEQTSLYTFTHLTCQSIDCKYFWDLGQDFFSPNWKGMHCLYLTNEIKLTFEKINSLMSNFNGVKGLQKLEFRVFGYDLNSLSPYYSDICSRMINVSEITFEQDQQTPNHFMLWLRFTNTDEAIEYIKVIYSDNHSYIQKVFENTLSSFDGYLQHYEVYKKYCNEIYLLKLLYENIKIDIYDFYNFINNRFEINYKLVVEMTNCQIKAKEIIDQNFTKAFSELYTKVKCCRSLFFHPLLHSYLAESLQSDLYTQIYGFFSDLVFYACNSTENVNTPYKFVLLIEEPSAVFADYKKTILNVFYSDNLQTTMDFNP